MKNEITILGCRAGAPEGGVPASGYLLNVTGHKILIDCGSGVVTRLTADASGRELGAVVITHNHADHCLDLVALAYYRLFPNPLPRLPLFGPPALAQTIELLEQTFGIPTLPALQRPLAQAFDFRPVPPGAPFAIGDLPVETMQTHHPAETLCLRFPGLGLVYTADGALTPELIAYTRGARILLAEATYATAEGHDLQAHGHMTARTAGELAQRSGVGTLVLTHLSDYNQQALTLTETQRVFAGPVIVAEPGLHIPLPS